jgi:arginine exporter protein ArgO
VNHDWIGPDIRNSVFVHVLHVLLLGGTLVYAWLAISAFTRKPARVLEGVRRLVYAAWLVVLFLLITKLNPVPYLGAAGVIAVLLLLFRLWDRVTAPGERSASESPVPTFPRGRA